MKSFLFLFLSVLFISCSHNSIPDLEIKPNPPNDGVRLIQKIEIMDIDPDLHQRVDISYNENGLIDNVVESVSFDGGQNWYLRQTIYHEYHDDNRVKNTKLFGVDDETGEDDLRMDINYEYSVVNNIITTHSKMTSTVHGSPGGTIVQVYEFNENDVLKNITNLNFKTELFYYKNGNLREARSLEDDQLITRTLIPDYDNSTYNILFKYGLFHYIPSILEPVGALSLRNYLVYETWNTELKEPASVVRAEYEFNDNGYPVYRRQVVKNHGIDTSMGMTSLYTYEIVD